MELMTPEHPRWSEFCARLEGPEGCDFREREPGRPDSITWRCGGGQSYRYAEAILSEMGFSAAQVAASIAYFVEQGGHCDCEVLGRIAA